MAFVEAAIDNIEVTEKEYTVVTASEEEPFKEDKASKKENIEVESNNSDKIQNLNLKTLLQKYHHLKQCWPR